jgi:hypothetical protein
MIRSTTAHPCASFLARALVAAALVGFVFPAAAAPDPACKPILDGLVKYFTVDHAETWTTEKQSGERLQKSGVAYLKTRGKWTKSPITPEDSARLIRQVANSAKSYGCKAGSDTTIDGTPAAVWKLHIDDFDSVSDIVLTVSKATGLPLLTVQDTENDESKRHTVTRFRYDGIHAPL